MKKHIALFLLLLPILVGCSTRIPTCIGKEDKALKISWGVEYTKKKTIEKFVLTTDRKIIFIVNDSSKSKPSRLSEEQYCNLLNNVQQTILQTQVINEIGDTLNFVEYENPARNIFVRARWNPRFKTKNSVHFRQLFDTLQVISLKIKH